MDKKAKNTMIVSVIALALVLIGVTYAYFSARITGLESASTISLTAGRMGIHYSEGDENVTASNIYPREEAWITKTITLTGWNTTNQEMLYDLGINVISNTFGHYLSYDLTLLDSDSGTPIANITNKAIVGTGFKKFGRGSFLQSDGDKHTYELKIYFKDNGKDQNDAQEAIFNAKIEVRDGGTNNPNATIATFDEGSNVNIKMKTLANVANNDNTTVSSAETENTTITAIQRSKTLKDGLTNDNIVSTAASAYPIYMWYEDGTIYYYTKAEKPQLNSDASKMFAYFTNLTNISGLSDMDTSTAITFDSLFDSDKQLSDLSAISEWNTSNIESMVGIFKTMFALSNLTSISNWDVSKVKAMRGIFYQDKMLTNLQGLENWDTSKLENLQLAFSGYGDITMNLTDISALLNWDVSNVTNLVGTFQKATKLTNLHGLEYWDTSNVINMEGVFMGKQGYLMSLTDISALSNWDVSNVTSIKAMFQWNSSLSNLHGLEKWKISSLDTMYGAFLGTNMTNFDLLKDWDVSSVTIFQGTFEHCNSLQDASGINNWNINATSNFNQMFFGSPTHPEFTKVQGTWDSEGTFTPNN